jgi:hypothetical protein
MEKNHQFCVVPVMQEGAVPVISVAFGFVNQDQ